MISTERRLIGQLGNQLFQVNLVMQIAKTLNIPYKYYSTNIDTLLGRVNEANKNFMKTHCAKNRFVISNDMMREIDIDDIHELIMKFSEKGALIVIKSGLLGEVLHKFLNHNPRELLTNDLVQAYDFMGSANSVAMHFRGRDFENWNAKAIMPPEYYFNALDLITSEFGVLNPNLHLFTDDVNHPIFQQIAANFKKVSIYSGPNLFSDFWALSKFKYLISSPSTFSFWAGVLTRNKSIIFQEEWVNNQINEGSIFWNDIKCNRNVLFKSVSLV